MVAVIVAPPLIADTYEAPSSCVILSEATKSPLGFGGAPSVPAKGGPAALL